MDFVGDFHIWLALGIIAVAVVLYVSEVVDIALASLLVLSLCLLVFWLFPLPDGSGGNALNPASLLMGFGNPALITIMAFLVMAQGLFQSAALDGIIERLTTLGRSTAQVSVLLLLLFAGVASAFLNNTPMVLMCIPILAAILSQARLAEGRAMMSLSFISILGGMTTLIGSSTNLLVADAALGKVELSFFTQTPFGLILAGVGALYALFVMPYLLQSKHSNPNSEEAESAQKISQGRQYLIEITLREGDSLVGLKPKAGFFPSLAPLTLRLVQHNTQRLSAPFTHKLAQGDILLLAATRKQLDDVLRDAKHPLHRLGNFATYITTSSEAVLCEAVVAPGSRMATRTIHQTGFNYETGCAILGVQRTQRPHIGNPVLQRLSDYRLLAGDVLLVLGEKKNIEALRSNRDVLPMEWRTTALPAPATAKRALAIFLGTIFFAATGLVPILFASLAGAIGMLFARVLNLRQAARGLNLQIYLLVATALAMATALERTGAATWVAEGFIGAFAGSPTIIILSAFFLLCAITTNLLSNNATAVLFTPIALNTAAQLGVAPTPFLFAVIFAANCSFATPIAYQTNLLVMAPGNYRFKDFLRIGTPLVLLLWLTFSLLAPFYFAL